MINFKRSKSTQLAFDELSAIKEWEEQALTTPVADINYIEFLGLRWKKDKRNGVQTGAISSVYTGMGVNIYAMNTTLHKSFNTIPNISSRSVIKTDLTQSNGSIWKGGMKELYFLGMNNYTCLLFPFHSPCH